MSRKALDGWIRVEDQAKTVTSEKLGCVAVYYYPPVINKARPYLNVEAHYTTEWSHSRPPTHVRYMPKMEDKTDDQS